MITDGRELVADTLIDTLDTLGRDIRGKWWSLGSGRWRGEGDLTIRNRGWWGRSILSRSNGAQLLRFMTRKGGGLGSHDG